MSKRQDKKKARGVTKSRIQLRAERRLAINTKMYEAGIRANNGNAAAFTKPGAMHPW